MGQSSSSSVIWRDKGRRSSYHGSIRRSKQKKPIMSRPYCFPPAIENVQLMNINIATEEQLMTLPGINRQRAREIVKHREIIGPFKQIAELLLISGISFKFSMSTYSLIFMLCTYFPFSTICFRHWFE